MRRAMDIVGAGGALTLASIPMVAIGAAIAMVMGLPILFRQERVGLEGRSFWLYKFRTMRDPRDPHGALLTDEARLTALGRVLRKTSLDELPEFLNVLQGTMTLVGPRPLLPQYLDRYSQEQGRRHEVLPGITGWAQVNGRNAISWEEKFALDVWYVDHRSARLDARILWMTLCQTIRGIGISADGHATMPEFLGHGGSPESGSSGSGEAAT